MFAGIGAQAKALENIGVNFEKYRICELDQSAVMSYNAIHKTSFTTQDIRQLNGSDLSIVDTDDFIYVMTYSFPCTSISQAGKRTGMEKEGNTASGLLWEVERILTECDNLPQILLMENVTQVHSSKNLFTFQKWQHFLTNLGYKNYTADLNAKDFGVAQSRERCFMISFLKKSFSCNFEFTFPNKKQLNNAMIDYIEPKFEQKRIYQMDKISHLLDSDKFIKNYNPNKKENKICQVGQIYPKSNMLIGRIYSPYGISPTLTTCCGGNHQVKILINDNNAYLVRKLSPKEYWRLMGFSDHDFDYASNCGSKKTSDRQLYKQAGNSIVVPVLEAIFIEVIKTCNNYLCKNMLQVA